MRLNFPYVFAFLQWAVRKDPARFKNLEVLECLPGPRYSSVAILEALNLPNLKHIRLMHMREYPFDMDYLPASLTALACDGLKPKNFDAAHLRNLTSLEVRLTRSNLDDFWHLLPNTLTHLVTDFAILDFSASSYNWKALPSQLRSFSVYCPDFNESLARLLPVTLEELLVIGDLTGPNAVSVLQVLPPLLKHLGISITSDPITPTIAQALPRSLRGSLDTLVQPEAVHLLPPGISCVELHRSTAPINISSANWSNLTSLVIPELDAQLAKLLSPHLTSLVIFSGASSPDVLAMFPPYLDVLVHLGGIEDWKLLPRYLDRVELSYSDTFDLVEESASWLPRTLHSLSLTTVSIPSCKWVSNLPFGLRELRLTARVLPPHTDTVLDVALPHLESLSIFVKSEKDCCTVEQLIRRLPRKLSDFLFSSEHKRKTDICGADIVQLPTSLTKLTLPPCPHLDEYDWEDCPPELANIVVGDRFMARFYHALSKKFKESHAQFKEYVSKNAQYLGLEEGESAF
jgi:hypothetical protein